MKRRDLVRGLSLLPFAGAITGVRGETGDAPVKATPSAPGMGPLVPGPAIFQSIGVEPLINCMGTFTIIGGSLERPVVRAAMEAASRNFVQYDELARGVGQRLAEITGAPWGMVSAGCAAGLKHVTAACVTGGNPEKLIRIPDLAGFDKTEVVIPRVSRNVYDHAIRNTGVTVITVDTLEALDAALGNRTAMVYLTTGEKGVFTVEAVAKLTKAKNIPLLVDAAAENLTIPCTHLEKGATVVAYSGGKAMCGPQCSGLLLGDKSLLQSAWQASAPHHGPGRDNKVGREEMIGALAAVEAWATMDHKAQWTTWLSYLDVVAKKISVLPGIKTTVREPQGLDNHSPSLIISWDPVKYRLTGEEMAEELGRNKPRIALAFGTKRNAPSEPGLTSINVTSGQMQPGEDRIVAERLFAVLSATRPERPAAMTPPAGSIAGRWDVTVKYYSSEGHYTWMLVQQGNFVSGTHTGSFSTTDMEGTLEGNQVKVRMKENVPGDRLAFTYTGELAAGKISGSVYLVEYGTAEFTAVQSVFPKEIQPISVPGGPPLAT